MFWILFSLFHCISPLDFPSMVNTIEDFDKSVQYYYMLEDQLRRYREDLENMRSRIDGVDDLTRFKAVHYEGSFRYMRASWQKEKRQACWNEKGQWSLASHLKVWGKCQEISCFGIWQKGRNDANHQTKDVRFLEPIDRKQGKVGEKTITFEHPITSFHFTFCRHRHPRPPGENAEPVSDIILAKIATVEREEHEARKQREKLLKAKRKEKWKENWRN